MQQEATLWAKVRSFHYGLREGYVSLPDGQEAKLYLKVLRKARISKIVQGDHVKCEIKSCARGLRVTRILELKPS